MVSHWCHVHRDGHPPVFQRHQQKIATCHTEAGDTHVWTPSQVPTAQLLPSPPPPVPSCRRRGGATRVPRPTSTDRRRLFHVPGHIGRWKWPVVGVLTPQEEANTTTQNGHHTGLVHRCCPASGLPQRVITRRHCRVLMMAWFFEGTYFQTFGDA